MTAVQIVRVADPFRLERSAGVFRVVDMRSGDVFKETTSPSTGQYALDRAVRDAGLSDASKSRPCMCCRDIFLSEGSHNRLCKTCRHKTAGMI